MLTVLDSSIFSSPAQTLVNPVNTAGVSGKGLALEFKRWFPQNQRLLLSRIGTEFRIGDILLWCPPYSPVWIVNFPTKTTWKQPSKLQYIEMGLERLQAAMKFQNSYRRIESLAFPLLGCGLGGLKREDVQPLIEEFAVSCPVPVYLHVFGDDHQ